MWPCWGHMQWLQTHLTFVNWCIFNTSIFKRNTEWEKCRAEVDFIFMDCENYYISGWKNKRDLWRHTKFNILAKLHFDQILNVDFKKYMYMLYVCVKFLSYQSLKDLLFKMNPGRREKCFITRTFNYSFVELNMYIKQIIMTICQSCVLSCVLFCSPCAFLALVSPSMSIFGFSCSCHCLVWLLVD